MRAAISIVTVFLLSCNSFFYQQHLSHNLKSGVAITAYSMSGAGVILESTPTYSYILTAAHLCNPEALINNVLVPTIINDTKNVDQVVNELNLLGTSKTACDMQVVINKADQIEILSCKMQVVDFAHDLAVCRVAKNLGVSLKLGQSILPGDNIYMVTSNLHTSTKAVILYNRAGSYMYTERLLHSDDNLKMIVTTFPIGHGASGSPVFRDDNHALIGIMARSFYSEEDNINSSLHINLMLSLEILNQFYITWKEIQAKNQMGQCLGEPMLCRFVNGQIPIFDLFYWVFEELWKQLGL